MSSYDHSITHAILGPASLVAFNNDYPISEGQHERKLKVIDILLEAGADPNCRSRDRTHALHDAWCHCRDLDIFLRLVRKGARLTEEKACLLSSESAKRLPDKIGRGNLHADDYAFLLQCSIEDSEKMVQWGWSERQINEAFQIAMKGL